MPVLHTWIYFFLTKNLSISLIKDHEYKAMKNHNHILLGYIVMIDRNKILIIKWYIWLPSSANPCTKIIKKQTCSKETRSKTIVAKYPKIYLNRPWEITSHTKLSKLWEITHYTWLTFISYIDRLWGQI
jgi:hypothetical protein